MTTKRLEPEEVLQAQLEYLNETAVSNAHEIAKRLKEDGNGLALAQLYHDAVATRKQLLDISKALIPYRAPRLESVELKQTIEHRFAVFSPEPIKKIEDFMSAVGKAPQEPVISRNTSKKYDKIIDMANVVDTLPEQEEEPDPLYRD